METLTALSPNFRIVARIAVIWKRRCKFPLGNNNASISNPLHVLQEYRVCSRFISEIQNSPAAPGYRQSRHKRRNSGTCWRTRAYKFSELQNITPRIDNILSQTTLIENRPITSALDHMSANGLHRGAALTSATPPAVGRRGAPARWPDLKAGRREYRHRRHGWELELAGFALYLGYDWDKVTGDRL
jgi:hypothetical protein